MEQCCGPNSPCLDRLAEVVDPRWPRVVENSELTVVSLVGLKKQEYSGYFIYYLTLGTGLPWHYSASIAYMQWSRYMHVGFLMKAYILTVSG
jgi:hypothetical protein